MDIIGWGERGRQVWRWGGDWATTLKLMWQQINRRQDFVTLPQPPQFPLLPPSSSSLMLPSHRSYTHLPPSPSCNATPLRSLRGLWDRWQPWCVEGKREERVRLSQNREAGGGERDDDGSQLWHWGEFWRSLLSRPAAPRLCFAGQEADQGGQGDQDHCEYWET